MLTAMDADPETFEAVNALVERTYSAMSTPGSDFATIFGHADMTVAGSGQGELIDGPDQVIAVAGRIASLGFAWVPERVRVWARGDVAWAQILGYVEVVEDAGPVRVPYWSTGVFAREADRWWWTYWGGAEPQAKPRV